MRFSRASRLGPAAFVAACIALAPTSAFAYNSNNHGHHYGQLKHQQTPPPNPPPGSQGIAQPVAGVHPAVATTAGQPIAPPAPATLPFPKAAPVIIRVAKPIGDGASWLVLLLLPVLAAVWLMVFARGAITISRRMRRSPAPA